MQSIRKDVLGLAFCVLALTVILRTIDAMRALGQGDLTGILGLPLTVILPALAFCYLATRGPMATSEGAVMQFGAMVQILLIIGVPSFALYLFLGFPVVFLVVELFETRLAARIRDPLKRMVLT